MRHQRLFCVAAALMAVAAAPAWAQNGRTEVGAGLFRVAFALQGDDDSLTTVGIPSGGVFDLHPGFYATLFATPHVAIEPQLGLLVFSSDGESDYYVNLVGQLDYFLDDASRSSWYLFGNGGMVAISESDTHGSLGAGLGYRKRVGDRVALRFDGRYTYITGESHDYGDTPGTNSFAFTMSIGALFGGN